MQRYPVHRCAGHRSSYPRTRRRFRRCRRNRTGRCRCPALPKRGTGGCTWTCSRCSCRQSRADAPQRAPCPPYQAGSRCRAGCGHCGFETGPVRSSFTCSPLRHGGSSALPASRPSSAWSGGRRRTGWPLQCRSPGSRCRCSSSRWRSQHLRSAQRLR